MGCIIKVCGMRERANIEQLTSLDIDLMGMIFYPKSPRFFLNASDNYDFASFPHTRIGLVGVFVNESAERICELGHQYHFKYVQLHGGEDIAFARRLRQSGLRIIKAVSVKSAEDIVSLDKEWETVADYMLFDYKCQGFGGSGQKFDWSVLGLYPLHIPFLLSGGIGEDDADAIRRLDFELMAGIDLNSKFETSPALKDIDSLQRFIAAIRQ